MGAFRRRMTLALSSVYGGRREVVPENTAFLLSCPPMRNRVFQLFPWETREWRIK